MSDKQSTYPPPQPFHLHSLAASSARKRRKVWPWIVGGVSAVLLLCCGIGVAASIGGDRNAKPAAVVTQATSAVPSRAAATSAAPVITAPSPPAPTTRAAAPSKPAPKPTYKALSEREWKLIAKNPDGYIGKTYIVYGVVTQFDSATGDATFRADIGHKNMANTYEYDTNTLSTDQPRNCATS
jgi:hypothetical protein